jgi:FMN phosphatase YigB (HAD superfamily)
MRETQIDQYFARIFSTTSDFHEVKKEPRVYEKIFEMLQAVRSEVIYVGDHYEFDYVVPKALDIESYYLDRSAKASKDSHVVHDLQEFSAAVTFQSNSSRPIS